MNDDGLTSETYCRRSGQERGGENALRGEKFTSRDCAKFGAAANFTLSRAKGDWGRVRLSLPRPSLMWTATDGWAAQKECSVNYPPLPDCITKLSLSQVQRRYEHSFSLTHLWEPLRSAGKFHAERNVAAAKHSQVKASYIMRGLHSFPPFPVECCQTEWRKYLYQIKLCQAVRYD